MLKRNDDGKKLGSMKAIRGHGHGSCERTPWNERMGREWVTGMIAGDIYIRL